MIVLSLVQMNCWLALEQSRWQCLAWWSYG